MIYHFFPYEKVKTGAKIVLYGMGNIGRDFFEQIQGSGYCEIVLTVDRNYQNIQYPFISVYPPDTIFSVSFDYVIIAMENKSWIDEVRKFLEQNGIKQEKIIAIAPSIQQKLLINDSFLQFKEEFQFSKQIAVIGDSHVSFFRGKDSIVYQQTLGGRINYSMSSLGFSILHLGPVLAYQLNRFGSNTQGREKIEFLCNCFLTKKSSIIFCFGEIDMRVYAVRNGFSNYKQTVDAILENYTAFLSNMIKRGYSLLVWGPVASQTNNAEWNPNYPANGTEVERNQATEYFTQRLREFCEKEKIKFLTLFYDLIDHNYCTKGEYFFDGCHLSQKAMVFMEDKLTMIKEPMLK